jgi:hypothetical protein
MRQINLTVSVFVNDTLILSEDGLRHWACRFRDALFADNPGWTAEMENFAFSHAPASYITQDPKVLAPDEVPKVPLRTFIQEAFRKYNEQA